MNNKALGSNTMKVGEQHRAFSTENYGRRIGHRAPDVGLNLCLSYDSVRGQCGDLIVVSNDAQGCYDCIAHTVLHMAMLHLGLPKPALQSTIETIQEMDHYLRTAFGVLDDHYGYNPNRLLSQGVVLLVCRALS